MHVGTALEDNEDYDTIATGVTMCLEMLHATDRVHRDIRKPNIMKFRINGVSSIQLIDYGYSGKSGDEFIMPEGIWRYAGNRIKQTGENVVKWTVKDDWEMFAAFMRGRRQLIK